MIVAAGVLVALEPLRDNSFLTHLATGRLILDRGSVPTRDPYSFSAPNTPWVVQSWLVSVLYATAERLGGMGGVRVVVATLSGVVAALGWRILRPVDGLVPRLGMAALFMTVGAGVWAERPFMVGLIAFALTVLAADGAFDPRWLVPLGWVWVNSHGSFPLGLVYLAALAVGARLDRDDVSRELRCLRWAIVGALAGAIGPLGPRLLTFPLELLQRQELLANVVEWQAPAFESVGERAFILQIVVAIVLLVRRPSYRAAVPMVVFVAAALLGSRNVSVASIVLLAAVASGLRGVGSLASAARPRYATLLTVVVLSLGTLMAVARLEERPLELRPYPIEALAYLEERDIDIREQRMAAPEAVGNLLTFLYGAEGRRVFYDDRFDMYPTTVSEAQLALSNAERTVFGRLAAYDIELLAVRVEHPMALVLTSDPAWRTLFVGERWQLACLRGADLGPVAGRC